MSDAPTSPDPRINTKAVVALVLIVLGVVFALSNRDKATVSFLSIDFTMPMWIWFVVLLGVGVVAGSLFPWLQFRRRRRSGGASGR